MSKEKPSISLAGGVQVTIKCILTECKIHHIIRTNHKTFEATIEILNNYPQSVSKIIEFINATNLQ